MGIGFFCDGSDGGSPAANSTQINFEKLSDDGANETVDFINFTHTNVWGDGGGSGIFPHWVGLFDSTGTVTVGGFTQAHRFCSHSEVHSQYLDTGSDWIKVDGKVDGGFRFTNAGATEPIN